MMTEDQRRLVAPVVRGFDPDIVEELRSATEKDNPNKAIIVEDRSGYVRIHAAQSLRVTRASLEEAAGQTMPLPSLEPAISAFAGRMRYLGDEELVWYLERKD
jgi:toluene monooxygenase system protein D